MGDLIALLVFLLIFQFKNNLVWDIAYESTRLKFHHDYWISDKEILVTLVNLASQYSFIIKKFIIKKSQ